jgi:hypothetical protein
MTTALLRRLVSMDRRELRFRARVAALRLAERGRTGIAPARWDRQQLATVLSASAPAAIRHAASSRHWDDAHHELAVRISTRHRSFVLDPRTLDALGRAIGERHPDAAHAAETAFDRIAAGEYDLLGYSGLEFGSPPDWHKDPVSGRRAPRRFWSDVPFLDPSCGDHKVIWELNRHQHWLALGRQRLLNQDQRPYLTFVRQFENWLAANPPLMGINWASMLEIAFRSLSWVWALHLFARDATKDATPWIPDMLVALNRQLQHVERNLSEYFSPNTHLMGEALALFVGGHALPELAASRRWIETGRDVLLAAISKQIQQDGGHAELSAHYHRYTTDFYLLALLVARAADDPAARAFEDAARRLSRYLRTIAGSDGMLPLTGDDDGGQCFPFSGRAAADASPTLSIAAVALEDASLAAGPPAEEALWLCGPSARVPRVTLAWPSAALSATGYYVARTDRDDQMMLDAGRLGYLNGGHAHADALSLVLTVGGLPLFVDPGTATYTMDPAMRDRFRDTAMHNTIVVDGAPQARPRGPFHWASSYTASASAWHADERFEYVEASHDAYAPRRHTRSVFAIHCFGWLIIDRITGEGDAIADAFWHLHPLWTPAGVRVGPGAAVAFSHATGAGALMASSRAVRVLDPGDVSGLTQFAPVYGRVVETHVLRSRVEGPLPLALATFIARSTGLQDVHVTVRPAVNTCAHGVAIDLMFAGGRAEAVVGGDTRFVLHLDGRAPETFSVPRSAFFARGDV